MALVLGSISAQGTAAPLTGGELLAINQELGPVIAATALVVGNSYRIETLGTTNWAAVGATATPAPGDEFRCDAVGTGTGTAQRIVTRTTTTQDVADLAAAGPGGGATNLTYAPATREIDSSTGTGAILPLAGTVVSGQPVAGLQTAADAARVAQLGEEDSPQFAGLTVTGTATAAQFDGGLTGAVSDHCRNVSGISLAALTPLYVTGSQGDTTTLEVVPARADTPSLMPAAGLSLAAMGTSGNAAAGHLVAVGPISGVDTAGLVSGAPLFVAPTGGTTATMPTTGLVQVMAIVGRVHATTGTVVVLPGPALSVAAFTGAYGDLSERPGEISQAEAEEGTGTTFRLWSAQRWRQAVAEWWSSITGATGRSLAAAANPAAARGTLELGSAALANAADFLTAAGDLAGVSSTSRSINNLFNGPRTPIFGLTPTAITVNAGSVAAFAATTSFPSGLAVTTGSQTNGASGLIYFPVSGAAWAAASGRLFLESIVEFHCGFNIVIPNLSTAGEAFTGHIGLYTDTAGVALRNTLGLRISGDQITATATAAGVETSSAPITIAANTLYRVAVSFVNNVLSVRVNNGAPLTVSSGFPSGVAMHAGVFIIKSFGNSVRQIGNCGGFFMVVPNTPL